MYGLMMLPIRAIVEHTPIPVFLKENKKLPWKEMQRDYFFGSIYQIVLWRVEQLPQDLRRLF